MAFNESTYFDSVEKSGRPDFYWKLEDDGLVPAVATLNGGSLAGTYASAAYVGEVDFASGWVDKTDECLNLYEDNGYLDLGTIINTSTVTTSAYTINMWLRPFYDLEDKIAQEEVLVSQDSATSSQIKFHVTLNSTNNVVLYYKNATGMFPMLISSRQLRKDTWHYVSIVVNDDIYSIYIDGLLDSTITSFGFTISENIRTFLGAYSTIALTPALVSSTTQISYTGLIDEVSIFTRAIADEQILSHYDSAELTNLDDIVVRENINVLTKIESFDVNWPVQYGALTYKKSVISSNPLVYHKFNGIGELQDFNYGLSGNTNLGVYTTVAPDADLTETVDLCDTACLFAGSGKVDCGGVVYTNGTKFTQEAWVRPTDAVSRVVVSNGKVGVGTYAYYIQTLEVGGELFVTVSVRTGVGTFISLTSAQTLVLDKWNHIVARLDGTSLRLFINGIDDSNVTSSTGLLQYDATYTLTYGASTYVIPSTSVFDGHIDEFAFYTFDLSDSLIYEHYRLGYYGLSYQPNYDVDTAPVFESIQSTTYTQSVIDSGATNLWLLNDPIFTDGQTFANSIVTGAALVANTQGGTPVDTRVAAPVGIKGEAYARLFKGHSNLYTATSSTNLGFTPATRTPITVEFWMKRMERNQEREQVMGFDDDTFGIYINKKQVGVVVQQTSGTVWDSGEYYYTGLVLDSPPKAVVTDKQDWRNPSTEWHHYTITVTALGYIKIWQDGELKFTRKCPDQAGIIGPAIGARFTVAKDVSSVMADLESNHMMGIATYNKELTNQEIQNRFMLGRFGEGFTKKTFTSDSTTLGTITSTCDELATLTNRRDITKYVETHSFDYQLDRVINTCLLTIKENIDSDFITQSLKVNDYVIVSHRYMSSDEQYDSGWVAVGHYLCDGAPVDEFTTTATTKVVKLSSLLKIITLDPFAWELSPDKLFVPKGKLHYYDATADTLVFRKRRDTQPTSVINNDDRFFYNWAESPSVKLTVTQFQNFYAGVDPQKANQDVTVSEEFQIRGSDGSIQVVGGAGEIRIDRDFYNSSVPEGGIGEPDKPALPQSSGVTANLADGVYAEFHRYATLLDTYGGLVNGATTINDMAIVDNKMCVSFSQTVPNLNKKTLIVKSGKAKGKIFKCWDTTTVTSPVRAYLTDINNRVVNPYVEGLKVGDYVQVGDCNLLEDVYRKFLLCHSFQEVDSSKPFYFKLTRCLSEVLVKPIKSTLLDNVSGLEVYKEIENSSPPNYYLYVDRNGVTRTTNLIVDDLSVPDHVVTYAMEEAGEASDFSVYTKVIGVGQSTQSIDIALHSNYGGTSAVRAYKLDRFAVQTPSDHTSTTGSGYGMTQTDANATIAQVFDNKGATPYLTVNGFQFIGLTYRMYGQTVRKIDLSSTDLFVLDLGLNNSSSDALEYEIDAIQLAYASPYREGAVINQSLEFFYMTEGDYIAEFGTSAPKVPSQSLADAATSYMPPADAKSWKVLIEDRNSKEGQEIIESSAFETGKPTKLRYIKVRVGQPAFRFAVSNKDKNRYSSVVLPDIKVYTSNRIIASAELGVTPPFATGNDKELAARYKRRTYITDINPYLNTYADTQQFAIDELREKQQEFKPKVLKLMNPSITVGDVVEYLPAKNYVTGETKKYLVYGVNYNSRDSHRSTVMLMNYDIV